MGIRLDREPDLQKPILLACWPGIGNIGVIAFNILKNEIEAEGFGEIEPWDFFYPNKVIIRGGELIDIEFPLSKFYFKKFKVKDLLIFIGEEQPAESRGVYAEGRKAYRMANLVLDVAQKFGCQRVYTSGAAIAPIHHNVRPRVWAVPNTPRLIDEIRRYDNTILMSDIEERNGQGNITGLNGLLLGVARKRGIDAVCIMGEIPIYLQGFPFPYPKASRSILEVITSALDIPIDMGTIDSLITTHQKDIEELYQRFPPEMREQLDKLKDVTYEKAAKSGPITEEDKKRILDDIDRFFKKGPSEG